MIPDGANCKIVCRSLQRIDLVLDTFSSLLAEVEHLTNSSYLDDKLKQAYLCIVKERIQRFIRKSE